MKRFQRFRITASLCLVAGLAGCGEEPMTEQPTGTVVGVVSMDGRPVAAGHNIVFMDNAAGTAVVGATNENGEYRLKWFRAGKEQDGIPIGSYGIMIQPPGASEENINVDDLSAEQMLAGEDAKLAPPSQQFPAKYRVIETSGLTAQIKEGENTIPVVLFSDPSPN